MRVHLDYLTNVLLRPFQASCSRSDSPMLEFTEIYLLTGSDLFPDRKLYLGLVSQLPQEVPQADFPLIFLCIEDAPVPAAYLKDRGVVMITCPPTISLPTLFNQTNLLFSNSARSAEKLWAFLGQIANSDTFTQLMHSISDIVGCSCMLLSQGFKTLGFYEHPEARTTHTWSTAVRRRYYPQTGLISRIRPNGLTVYDPETRRIADKPTDYPESGDAFYPLVSEDSAREVLGFLYFSYPHRDSFITRLYIIQFVAYALSFRMWRYMNSPSNSNSALCFLLRDVISGALINDEEIGKRLENIRFTPAEHTFLIVIYSSAMDNRKYSWAHLKMVFSQLFPDDVLLTYNGDIVLLVSSCNGASLPADKAEALTQLLKEHGCYAGISACFDRLDRSLKNYYVRAMAAAKTARNWSMENHYTFYTDVALLHFVREGASMENLRDLCDPRILRLAAYDRSHASNYIYTLQCYWHYNQNIQSTCEHLFIHRNTLFYRLKKIKEIVDLDYNNSKHLVQFNLSFAILTALGDLTYNDFPSLAGEELSED